MIQIQHMGHMHKPVNSEENPQIRSTKYDPCMIQIRSKYDPNTTHESYAKASELKRKSPNENKFPKRIQQVFRKGKFPLSELTKDKEKREGKKWKHSNMQNIIVQKWHNQEHTTAEGQNVENDIGTFQNFKIHWVESFTVLDFISKDEGINLRREDSYERKFHF